MLILVQVENLLRKKSRRSLSRPQASILARLEPPQLDLIQRNVTQVGINTMATSTGGFLHSPCVDPRPRYLYGARHLLMTTF